MQALAELGFIVVQIDGMGTANRSKAFHDVGWKNLGDAGFPDRILWHKAVAAKYPWYDITPGRHLRRLGRRPERARARCSSIPSSTRSRCRFAAATTTAWTRSGGTSSGWAGRSGRSTRPRPTSTTRGKLQGKLLLVVGEMDTNVDPASTMQVVNALIKANKDFDLLVVPGAEHRGPRRRHGLRRAPRFDFFVRNLLGVEPPNWNED